MSKPQLVAEPREMIRLSEALKTKKRRWLENALAWLLLIVLALATASFIAYIVQAQRIENSLKSVNH